MSLVGKWFGFSANALYDDGVRAFDSGDYPKAATLLEECLRSETDPAIKRLTKFFLCEVNRKSAAQLSHVGKWTDVAAALTRAIELQPNYADLWFLRGKAHDTLKMHEDAEHDLARAIELNPHYGEAHFLLGILLLEDSNSAGWLRVQLAAETFGSNETATFAAAQRLFEQGDFEGSASTLRELPPRPGMTANEIARSGDDLVRLGHFFEAAQEYERALQIAPRYADILCKHGQALLELDEVERAADRFRLALEINPKYVEALAQLGIALKRIGLEVEAREAFSRAYELEPNHIIASQELRRHSWR